MDTTTRRRFDVEFCDETSGEPLIRLERVPFDISQTVQSLRAELELRSGWTDFGLLVRQGLDGPTINLSERDTLDDAVAADEMVVAIRYAFEKEGGIHSVSMNVQEDLALGHPLESAQLMSPLTPQRSIAHWQHHGSSYNDLASFENILGLDGAEVKQTALEINRQAIYAASKSDDDEDHAKLILVPGPSSVGNYYPIPLGPRAAQAAASLAHVPLFTGLAASHVPNLSPVHNQSHTIVPLSYVFATLRALLGHASTLPQHKMVVFFPTHPYAKVAAWVLRSLGGVGDVYEAHTSHGKIQADKGPHTFHKFIAAQRGVLFMNGFSNELVGLTGMIQVGLYTSPMQYARRWNQPKSPQKRTSFYIFGRCEEKAALALRTARPPLWIGKRFNVPLPALALTQAAVRNILQDTTLSALPVKASLGTSLRYLWVGYGIDDQSHQPDSQVGEISDFLNMVHRREVVPAEE